MVMNGILATISGDTVNVTGSPQNLASNWIINQDSAYICPQDPTMVQRYSLAVFYYATEGDDWRECSAPSDFSDADSIAEANADCTVEVSEGDGGTDAWLTPSSECQWGGTRCDGDFIEKIEFEDNEVAGSLPTETSRLNQLKYLVLEEGFLSGTIPPEIGDLARLEVIDLNFNILRGPIPTNFYRLNRLQQLDLNDNELTGSINTNIGRLQSMTFFQVENNQMTGDIPSEMGKLALLEVATLNNNDFMGTMPQELCDVSTLDVLTADCMGPSSSPGYVECDSDCCTQCF